MLRRVHLLSKHLFPSHKLVNSAKMSTFNLPGSDVSISLIDGLSQEELLKFPAFKVKLPFPIHYNANKYHRTGLRDCKAI